MARYKYEGVWIDGAGNAIASGTVSVLLANSTTAATCYSSATGAALTGGQTTTDAAGTYSFWVDTSDYNRGQKFKVSIAKTNYNDFEEDYICVPGFFWDSTVSSATISSLTISSGEATYFNTTTLAIGGVVTTSFGKSLIDDANAAAGRTTLGVETSAFTHIHAAATEGWRFNYVSATACALERDGGAYIFVNGQLEPIPSSGVKVLNTGLTSATVYNAFAYLSGGSLTVGLSTSGHAADTTYGHEIMTGNTTKSLVGKIRANGSSQFVDSTVYRHVISWKNRKPRPMEDYFSAPRSITSTSWTVINSELLADFIAWANDPVNFLATASVAITSGSTGVFVNIGTMGAVPLGYGGFRYNSNAGGDPYNPLAVQYNGTPGEGRSQLTLLGKLYNAAHTAYFYGSATSTSASTAVAGYIWG